MTQPKTLVRKGRSMGPTMLALADYDAKRCKGSLSSAQLVAIALARTKAKPR